MGIWISLKTDQVRGRRTPRLGGVDAICCQARVVRGTLLLLYLFLDKYTEVCLAD
jgi:hypothetical protein